VGATASTRQGRPREGRIARLLASPASVLIIVPALVIGVGIGVLLLGRRATRDSAETMARHQLVAQAEVVQRDVSAALDQAGPVLSSLRVVAESELTTEAAVTRIRDIVTGRPGVAYASIVFPSGRNYGSYLEAASGELMVLSSVIGAEGATERTNYGFRDGVPYVVSTETSKYDPRTRPRYKAAIDNKARAWMPPRTFSSSHKTGLTVTEPIYAADGALVAVLTLDFDVGELSAVIGRPPLANARTIMFTPDGTVLANPSAPIPDIAVREERLLRYEDFSDPALDALFRALAGRPPTADAHQFMHVDAKDGRYLASISGVGGRHGGTAVPADWYLATLVPEETLFGATWRFGRETILASLLALAIAVLVALMFAWNLVRMRRAVAGARAQARSAEERAKELGSYRLTHQLGVGGMGEVWRAEHQLLAREAAIKLVRTDGLTDPRDVEIVHERFRREAQTLASLRSRHTIELYDYGVTEDGAFFLVMELLDGLDLAQLVRGHGPQPAARVISIIAQACQSLAEAHDARLFHRDIKPANLFLCRAADEVDIVKLLDFGIVHNMSEPIAALSASATARRGGGAGSTRPGATATAAPVTGERLTTEGAVIGTPGYIPPEMVGGVPFDARGDLYALGCVAWVLLTGREVFEHADDDALLMAHIVEPVPSLRARMTGWLPPELERLIAACLAKQPADRPTDARALANALFAIEVPDEHAWTRDHATAWWRTHRPMAADGAAGAGPEAAAAPAEPTALGRRVVATRAEPRAEAGREARTIEARRRPG
jgi:serine/threonine protein kinase